MIINKGCGMASYGQIWQAITPKIAVVKLWGSLKGSFLKGDLVVADPQNSAVTKFGAILIIII